jgi:serine/threonine-protein kinase
MRGDLLRAAAGRPVLATPVMPPEERTMPIAPPQPRLIGNRNTGTMARVGNPQRRRASNWVIACLVILGVLAVGALGTGLYLAYHTPQSRVPDLKDRSVADAQRLLALNKLRGEQHLVFNADCTKDTVVDQTMAPQTRVNQNTVISYDVCGGPQSVKVPPLVGLSKDAASAALSAAQLTPNFENVDSLVNDKGKVVSVDPKEQQDVPQGSTVTVGIGKGNQAQIPDLSGLSEAQARQRLSDLGFHNVSAPSQLTDDPDAVNTVTGQSPSPGTTRKLSDRITIFIGKLAEVSSPTPSVTESSGSPTP